jgi:glutathione S-transferase
VDEVAVKANVADLETALNQMEEYFLRDHAFLTGDKVSIADLKAARELMQVICIGTTGCRGLNSASIPSSMSTMPASWRWDKTSNTTSNACDAH